MVLRHFGSYFFDILELYIRHEIRQTFHMNTLPENKIQIKTMICLGSHFKIKLQLEMTFDFNGPVRFLDVSLFFRSQLLSASRERLVDPSNAAEANNRASHALLHPR